MMKKNLYLFITVFLGTMLLSLSGPGKIVVKGSDTLLPFTQKQAEIYMKKNKAIKVTVTGGGSGVGIAAFMGGTTDIAMASRNMKFSEKAKLKKQNKEYKEVVVALDAIAVVVNKKNPISKLTQKQLEGIFTGKYTNWKQLGGKDVAIVAYSRESSSGTYEYFKKVALNKKNYGLKTLLMPSTGAIVQAVSQSQGGIGYIGFSYLNNYVKTVNLSFDGGKYVEPTKENAKKGLYPISRELYYYYLKNNERNVKPFLNFVLSQQGQKIAEDLGYIPVK